MPRQHIIIIMACSILSIYITDVPAARGLCCFSCVLAIIPRAAIIGSRGIPGGWSRHRNVLINDRYTWNGTSGNFPVYVMTRPLHDLDIVEHAQ